MTLPKLFPRAASLLLALAISITAVTSADVASPRSERLLQNQLKQQQIQRTTQRVGEQLSGIIGEFERNGINGEDVKVLRAIRTVLGRLSEKEMTQVVTLLEQALKSGDDANAKKDVTQAYSGQKTIITQLKQLLLEYQRQQALYEMSIMLRGLAARQSVNMRVGVWLARQSDSRPLANYGEDEKRYLQQQEIDQIALRDEVAQVLGKLERLAKESDGTATGERPKAALDEAKKGGLMTALNGSAEDLKNGRLLSATGNEKKARDQMRDVARTLLLSKDLVDLLRAAIQETESAILQQKQVLEQTRKMERKDDPREAEDKQFEVVDNTDLIRRDINDVATTAASYFRNALDRMQEARAILNQGNDTKFKVRETPLKQTDAIANLEQARRALQEQLAKAEQEAQKPESVLANLHELQKQVQELIKKEEKLKEETALAEKKPQDLRDKAPQQGEIRDATQDVQQKAASDAPEAAQALNDAATQMEKAQKDLARSKNSPEAEQAAVEALKKAETELGEKIAKLEKDEKQLAELEKLLEKVEVVIKEEQTIRLDTAKNAIKPETKPADQIAKKQQTTGEKTAEAQKEAQEPVPSAAEHLAQAKEQMNDSKAKLDEAKSKDAQPPQNKAIKELYAAKKDIEAKMDELKKELGKESDNSKNLADAQAALEKAQKEVNDAQQQMANPDGLLDALQKQQQAIADSLNEAAQSAPSPKTQQAQKDAAQAAQQLAQNDLKSAVGSMQKAQEGIEAAQAGDKKPPGEKKPNGQPDKPSLPQLGEQQAEVKKLAENLLAAQEAVSEQAMQQAAQSLEQALNDVSPIAAGEAGQLPQAAQDAVQAAQDALTQAAAQAAGQQAKPAQANAAQAAQALAQAQAALSLAQAGLSSEMAQGQQPGQGEGQQPGQGQSPGQGQGQGKDGQKPGPGKGTPPPKGSGKDGNWNGQGGADGAHRAASGTGTFIGLPKRDRAAIQQSQAEKYPQEYGPLVEQYLKNLSDQSGE